MITTDKTQLNINVLTQEQYERAKADETLDADALYMVPEELSEYTGSGGSTDWSDITNKPQTFPPSSHTHTTSQITNFPVMGNYVVYEEESMQWMDRGEVYWFYREWNSEVVELFGKYDYWAPPDSLDYDLFLYYPCLFREPPMIIIDYYAVEDSSFEEEKMYSAWVFEAPDLEYVRLAIKNAYPSTTLTIRVNIHVIGKLE